MARGQLGDVMQYVRRLTETADADGLSDRELLERFAARRDREAFAQIVRRHGPMVRGVCRRLLAHCHDAEDAFQATFLVLARKAALRTEACAGPWLHGVAVRLSLKQRSARRLEPWPQEPAAAMHDDATPDREAARREFWRLFDEALQSLPDKWRRPLIVCVLEGHKCPEAARLLGWPLRTLERRLEEGKKRLGQRLRALGLAPTAGAIAGVLTAAAPAPLSAAAAHRLADLAVAFVAGNTALLSGANQAVVALANELLAGTKGTWKALVVVLALSLATIGDSRVTVGLPFEPQRRTHLTRKAADERQPLLLAQRKLDEIAPRVAKFVEAMIVLSKAEVVKTWFDGPEAHITVRWRLLPVPGSEPGIVRLSYHYPRHDYNIRFDWHEAGMEDRWINQDHPLVVLPGRLNSSVSGAKEAQEIREAFEELAPLVPDHVEPPGDVGQLQGNYRWGTRPCAIEVVDQAAGKVRVHFPRGFPELSEMVLDGTFDPRAGWMEVCRDGKLISAARLVRKPSGAHTLRFSNIDWWYREVGEP